MTKAESQHRKWRGVLLRLVAFVLLAGLAGTLLNQAGHYLSTRNEPAGFGRGIMEGVLMPMAWPNLLVGRDVAIYSARNTGTSYKLGYTLGVNGCGAVFFGILFWRLSRWRKG
jgi:hypothetical protein